VPEHDEIRRAGFAISKGEVQMSADGRIARALKLASAGYDRSVAAKGNVEC
jgi:hypothetical protein